jgi:pimeloyl-ACP methyl ester carboxylesterase
MQTLFKQYEGRVLAYQHRTLTVSPIENAAALVKDLVAALGENAELHVVSHSRGGLVGELLARGMRVGAAPITPEDLELFEIPNRQKDREALEHLSTALQSARLRVTRFVRVACPARGTTLADGRLDKYVSVLVNLAMIVGLKGNPVYDGLTSLLAGVLKKRTDPGELPGIEAMMPTSPLVRMLNRPGIQTDADLHVLGGDLAGVGIFGRLKTLATDVYYRDDHDLVVNTPAMLGGMERTKPVPYWIDTGDQVTHFNYFARADTSRRLVAALAGSNADFRTLEVKPSVVTSSDYVKRGIVSRPVVFVLPGIMGSQLTVDDVPVWMNIRELALGGLSLLQVASTSRIHPKGLLTDGYGALCDHLNATHDVIAFPYDWRRSVDVSAKELRKRIEEVLPFAEAANQPIRLLAHSMGGLVVRMMLATPEGRATWDRMCRHAGSRFIMLGTPNGGSHAIVAMLMGRDSLVKKLALVDFRNSHGELLQTIAGFEGALSLLPHPAHSALDVFNPEVWKTLLDRDAPETRGLFGSSVATSKSAGFRWTLPDGEALKRARQNAERIQQSPLDPARVTYVAGLADETACDVVVDETAPHGRKVRVMASAQGDGRVLWKTGIPGSVRAFYMDTVHGDMANDRRHFPAIVDLLNTGTTARLATTPPVRRDRDADAVFEMRDAIPAMIPDESELIADALGGRRSRIDTKPGATKIAVRVVHDNLANAKSPVLVSHYRQDVIVAAEEYLDRCLNGRLSELHRMELYPGPLNTAVVVVNDRTQNDQSIHPGAVVAGLGNVGELTPGTLTSTLAHALTMYGAESVGQARRRQQRGGGAGELSGVVSVPLTAILVGSGDGGLTLSDSIRALLTAVQQANRRLHGPESTQPGGDAAKRLYAQIDSLEIVELYEDRAIEAVHLLRRLEAAPEFESFNVLKSLVHGAGGLRRVRFDQASSWWQRISVKEDEAGALQFEAVTQAARASAKLLPLQHGHVDVFVRQAKGTTSYDPALGRTLFELLVPNDFKAHAPDQQKLAMLLTPETAKLPWELLQDGFDRTSEPLSVASGMLRQLVVPDERQQVLRAPSNSALVIGNPKVTDPRFPALPGATSEATSVAGVLADSNYDVTLLLEEAASPDAVLMAIHQKPWRVLHLAAHGVFEFDRGDGKEPVSGLILDHGLFFTAADADQMRYVPELVFINCCHLGNTEGDSSRVIPFHKLAANLATQFIKMGARAVIAAGWAVDDAAAKTFATSLYQRLLDGEKYGDAMRQARRDTYRGHGHTNTWGAYQCYGDPSFSLTAGQSVSRAQTFVSDSELRMWLLGVAARARMQDRATAALLKELQQQVLDTPDTWWESSSDLCATAADAFLELGEFTSALQYFEQAVGSERADAPIRALEQLASCKVRWARTLARAEATRAEAPPLLNDAEQVIRNLLALGETSERWSLLGSVMKQKAILAATSDERQKALGDMSDAYGKAYEKSKKNGTADTYPLGNQLAADVVLSWQNAASGNGHIAAVSARLAELEEAANKRLAEHTDAYNLSAAADRLLLQALLDRKLDEAARQAISQKFVNAMSRGATTRVRDSMRAQFDFFRSFLVDTALPQEVSDEMRASLQRLQEMLL